MSRNRNLTQRCKDAKGESQAGLYVHVPFCRAKCAYCDFYSIAAPNWIPAWLAALQREMRGCQSIFERFDTVYIGGGTPSLLDDSAISTLLEALHRHFCIEPNAEITLESNPQDATPKRLSRWKALGVNRVSVGIQSLYDPALRHLGRSHTAAQARRALADLANAEMGSVSADLIYGFRGLSLTQWQDTLQQVCRTQPDHLSCYQMTLAAGTRMAALQTQGTPVISSDREAAAFFRETQAILVRHGYGHYEVSNFAGKGKECRHNAKYWSRAPYLGLGPSAHSFQDPWRWWNVASVSAYCRSLLQEEASPISGRECLTGRQQRMEAVSLGLRTRRGVRLDAVEAGPSTEQELRRLLASGAVVVQGDCVSPTLKGLRIADYLGERLCP